MPKPERRATAARSWPNARLVENQPLISGRDYGFDRIRTRRAVEDESDRGEIELVTYVYRPLRGDRGRVALFLHGSTAGMRVDPGEPFKPPASVIRYFVQRGFTLFVPLRRGRAESGGHYVEECNVYADRACARHRYVDIAAPALEDAVADTRAFVEQELVDEPGALDAPLVVSGQSRGGFLALAVAAAMPERIGGVVSFAGGWLRVGRSSSSTFNTRARQFAQEHLRRFAKGYPAETLWIHAAHDSFYSEATTREFFDFYREAGGRGRYHFIAEHPQPDGHQVVFLSELWADAVDDYLEARGFEMAATASPRRRAG